MLVRAAARRGLDEERRAPSLDEGQDGGQAPAVAEEGQLQLVALGCGEMAPESVVPFPGLEGGGTVEAVDEAIPLLAQCFEACLGRDDADVEAGCRRRQLDQRVLYAA